MGKYNRIFVVVIDSLGGRCYDGCRTLWECRFEHPEAYFGIGGKLPYPESAKAGYRKPYSFETRSRAGKTGGGTTQSKVVYQDFSLCLCI